MNKSNITTLFLIATMSMISACVSDDFSKAPFEYQPETLNDGWTISTPEAEGLDPNVVRDIYQRFFDNNQYKAAMSFLIVRHGKLVAEAYFRDKSDRDHVSNLKSATKSIVSLSLGIAIDKGVFANLDVPLFDIMPNSFPDDDARLRKITLRHLVTMQSGLDYNENSHDEKIEIDDPDDSLRWHLSLPMKWEPGTRFNYANSDPHLISGAIKAKMGMPLDEYARINLFEPLGITDYIWQRRKDGVSIGGYTLHLKSRDMAKIGQLMLNNGVWNGQQIVSTNWITESTTAHVNFNDGPYGYFWWIRPDFNAYMASGFGGQTIYVIPGKDLVLVFTGWPYAAADDWNVEDEVLRIVSSLTN